MEGEYLPTLERYGDRSHRRYSGVGGEDLFNYVTQATAKLRREQGITQENLPQGDSTVSPQMTGITPESTQPPAKSIPPSTEVTRESRVRNHVL
jgi:hypothetical protein